MARTKADLVLRNGKIVTMDPSLPEARALAIQGESILAVGSDADIGQHLGPSSRVIDLAQGIAIPGFIEGHGHFTGIGKSMMTLDLTKVRNWEEVVAKVADAARTRRPGEWILGRGWHQEKWDTAPSPNVEGFPRHDAISKVSPENPVLLTHASGHATLANAKAMELAGASSLARDPAGGQILRDGKGAPSGLFLEAASDLFEKALVEAGERTIGPRREIQAAIRECLSKGITTFHDAGSPLATIDLFKELAVEGKLGLRLWVMIREGNAVLRESLGHCKIIDCGGGHLTVRALKSFMDGALGSRGAWLLEPYRDLPAGCGLNTTPLIEIRETACLAIEHGFQLCVHAIGDRAIRETLNIFEASFKAHPDKTDLRWRIEHAQHVSAEDIPRFHSLGVIASMQGIHCTSDARFVLARLGARRSEEGAYAWRKLINAGTVIVNGTDAPVEDVDPIGNYYASVSRRIKDGSVFYPGQRMSRMEALKSYTIDAAYAAFEERVKGSLVPGKLADITVLSRDILTIPEDEIPGVQVTHTIVGGKVLYSR